MRVLTILTGLMGLFLATITAGGALADDRPGGLHVIGKPTPGGTGFQPPATELARDVIWLDGMVNVIIFSIVGFVTLLLIYILLRFNRRANPTPATFTHHTPIEIVWTVVPIIILVFIGAFSLQVLYKQQEIPEADITIKVTGFQWYWNYEYPDSEFSFDSFMLGRDQLEEYGYMQDEYLLATDNAVVVPIDKIIVMQVTGADVIHAWAVPAFGVKQDGVPGRVAELWFKAEKEGIFFGQCSELCGKDHSFMPITVKVVSQQAYDIWLAEAAQEFAGIAPDVTPADITFAENN